MPTWLQNDSIVVVRTQNGWALTPEKSTPVEQALTFETWAALAYFLETNFVTAHQG